MRRMHHNYLTRNCFVGYFKAENCRYFLNISHFKPSQSPESEDFVIDCVVLTQYQRVIDRRTDGHRLYMPTIAITTHIIFHIISYHI